MTRVSRISSVKAIAAPKPRRRVHVNYQFEHLTCSGFGHDGHPLWDCDCGTKAKRIELKNLHYGKGGSIACGCKKTKNFKCLYQGLVDGLSREMKREAYRLVGAGRLESTQGWLLAAASQLRAKDRDVVDSNVLSFAAHAHRKSFIEFQGTEGLERIAKIAKSSAHGFCNLRRQGLNKAEIHLALRETRKSIQGRSAETAEPQRIDREQLCAELDKLMQKVSKPSFRALGAERLADQIVECLHHVAVEVKLRADRGFNSVELPSPGTKAFLKSKKLLVWCYRLLADVSDSDLSAYIQISKLWKILNDALERRNEDKQLRLSLMRFGILPTKSEYKRKDQLGLGNVPAGLAPDVAAELYSVSINNDLAVALAGNTPDLILLDVPIEATRSELHSRRNGISDGSD